MNGTRAGRTFDQPTELEWETVEAVRDGVGVLVSEMRWPRWDCRMHEWVEEELSHADSSLV
jgi:hypothetical protein